MELLSDHFHIYTDDNGVITGLKPDIKDGHNPELKNLNLEHYIYIYIEDVVKYFCKANHIRPFWWKRFGHIESCFSWHSMTCDFIIRYRRKTKLIQFHKNSLNANTFQNLSIFLRK